MRWASKPSLLQNQRHTSRRPHHPGEQVLWEFMIEGANTDDAQLTHKYGKDERFSAARPQSEAIVERMAACAYSLFSFS
jgi:hypothetical protein